MPHAAALSHFSHEVTAAATRAGSATVAPELAAEFTVNTFGKLHGASKTRTGTSEWLDSSGTAHSHARHTANGRKVTALSSCGAAPCSRLAAHTRSASVVAGFEAPALQLVLLQFTPVVRPPAASEASAAGAQYATVAAAPVPMTGCATGMRHRVVMKDHSESVSSQLHGSAGGHAVPDSDAERSPAPQRYREFAHWLRCGLSDAPSAFVTTAAINASSLAAVAASDILRHGSRGGRMNRDTREVVWDKAHGDGGRQSGRVLRSVVGPTFSAPHGADLP